jgi:23S rRNA (uracil1939-C5)-methyltransferase
MDLALRRREGGVLLGLHRAFDTEIIDFTECFVLHPALFALLAPLRKTLSSLAALRGAGAVVANLLASGPDLLIRTDGPLTPADRIKLASFAQAHGVPRIAWALGNGPSEIAAQGFAPHAMFAGQRVEPPPGAFLQASAEGEAAIVAAVLAGLPEKLTGKSRAIELFAGVGTLSFPLAAHLRVLAYEGDAPAAAAVRRAQAGSRVEMTQRDLARQPVSVKEFSGAALIVLDPPYTGAAAQMPAIAASGVGRVIYVSCNPGALAKDAEALRRHGYMLKQATPIDQFLWSAQVESVCVFLKT